MKILVTGGGGFVGKNLVKKLVDEGHDVTITATGSEPVVSGVKKVLYMGLEGINLEHTEGQNAVVHLMANNDTLCEDKDEMFRANVFGPMKLFTRALKGGCKKFIYASSTAVYGSEPAPYVEDKTPINPLNIYAKSKAVFDEFASCFAKENMVQMIGFRYCNIYGPGEESKGKRMSMVGQILRTMVQGKEPTLFEFGEQKRDWIFIDDVVEANLLAIKNKKNIQDIYNIGSGKCHTFNEIIEIINQIIKLKIKTKYIPCVFKESYQSHTECDISKAKRELGFYPKFSLRSGIEKYLQNLSSSY